MSTAFNKRVTRVVLDDLTRETTYECFADRSEFEGHMVDYEASPIRKEDDEQRAARLSDLRSEMRRAGTALLQIYPDGNTRAIKSITAEGDRVVAEYLVHAGRTVFDIDNEHNFHVVKVLEFDDGRIVRMREYCDSAYLNAHAGPIADIMHRTTADSIDTASDVTAWSSDWCLADPDVRLESDEAPAPAGWPDHNREVALRLSETWGDASMAAYLDHDVFFNNELDRATSPQLSRGIKGRAELISAAVRAASAFAEGPHRTVTATTAENNRVVVEEEIRGTIRSRPGVQFRMRQAKVCVLREGRVHRIRQYLDSGYLQVNFPELADLEFEYAAL
ncbi:hypothetical protein ACQPZZ_37265 [Microbispora sp. CA-135349]|uniref:hypothetical protein n=1 Tax=Microbispora sp. CA-135349 TaxID=3239953 RepID=UPI003D924F34